MWVFIYTLHFNLANHPMPFQFYHSILSMLAIINYKNGNVLYHANENTQKYNVGKRFQYNSQPENLTLLLLITIVYRKLPYPGHDKYQTCVGCNVSKYLFFLIRLFCIRYSFHQPSTNIDSDTLEIFWKNKAYVVFVSKYHT